MNCFRTLLLAACLGLPGNAETYDQRPAVKTFIQTLADKEHFQAAGLADLFAHVHYQEEAARLAAPAGSSHLRNWRMYRSGVLDSKRIQAGAAFWRRHAKTLARAERQYGVPPEIIVGILGVETFYGKRQGRFPVLDVLTTLAFDHPATPQQASRSAMFQQQLADFLIWCRDTGTDPASFRGSYAGAIGIPQFLPGSLRTYGVDFDQNGTVDLRKSPVDAIGSVARFLKEHGWEAHRPVHLEASQDRKSQDILQRRADGVPLPQIPLGELTAAGLRLEASPAWVGATTHVLIIDLPTPSAPTLYRVGLMNFYVITRYNKSFFYAQSVIELGHAVKRALHSRKRRR